MHKMWIMLVCAVLWFVVLILRKNGGAGDWIWPIYGVAILGFLLLAFYEWRKDKKEREQIRKQIEEKRRHEQ